MKLHSTVQGSLNFKTKQGNLKIPGIDHAISTQVVESIQKLEFDLSVWDHNPRIGGLLSRTVLSGGKRLRPLVNFLMADFFGISHDDISPFARVVELIHAATLAHDDVIDDAQVRRGEPSINAVASNKKAVLAGDFLLAYAVDQVAQYNRGELVRCLTKVIRDLAEGEWLQIENNQAAVLSRDDIVNVALKKTGSVLRWCCEMPPLYRGLSHEICERAAKFGENLGIAFQMTDDILDFKRRDGAEFADLKNGVINSVIYEAMVISPTISQPNAQALAQLRWDASILEDSLRAVTVMARSKLDGCRQLLLEMIEMTKENPASEQKSAFIALTCLIEYLANRV